MESRNISLEIEGLRIYANFVSKSGVHDPMAAKSHQTGLLPSITKPPEIILMKPAAAH